MTGLTHPGGVTVVTLEKEKKKFALGQYISRVFFLITLRTSIFSRPCSRSSLYLVHRFRPEAREREIAR